MTYWLAQNERTGAVLDVRKPGNVEKPGWDAIRASNAGPSIASF
jgi:hypothetical protein